ncbi:hypothetical protein EUGRSUZ_H04028 [Eucalyptus grandis]|uniref:Uncharacterized protein n=2 Tax=Eucalyptus grandis TaxID=71139 RepID=A0ACC3JWD6_EUCGR|nr:hypothetical protein EUGRSUZ_H04028 [Eucalyptus grandis]
MCAFEYTHPDAENKRPPRLKLFGVPVAGSDETPRARRAQLISDRHQRPLTIGGPIVSTHAAAFGPFIHSAQRVHGGFATLARFHSGPPPPIPMQSHGDPGQSYVVRAEYIRAMGRSSRPMESPQVETNEVGVDLRLSLASTSKAS